MPTARSRYSSAAPGKGVRVRADPVNVCRIIRPTRWTPVSRIVSSTSEMTPNARGVTRDQYVERRGHRVGDAAILLGELDGPAGPRGDELVRVWLQAHLEVAVGVGGGLDGGACDRDARGTPGRSSVRNWLTVRRTAAPTPSPSTASEGGGSSRTRPRATTPWSLPWPTYSSIRRSAGVRVPARRSRTRPMPAPAGGPRGSHSCAHPRSVAATRGVTRQVAPETT